MKPPRLPIASTLARATAELAIIVAGVLIALAAQSWWETQGEAEERDRALAALASDLAVIGTTLEDRQTAAVSMSEGLVRVIEGADLQSLTDSAYITTVQDAAWTHFGDGRFPFPAFTDLQSSGRLRLLPDTIRIALTRFAHTLDLVGTAFANVQEVQENQLDPWVAQNFDATRVVWRPGIGYAYPGLPDARPLGTREGRSRVAMKLAAVTSLRRDLSIAAAEVAELQAAIQQISP